MEFPEIKVEYVTTNHAVPIQYNIIPTRLMLKL
jgi:hypothetical protein